jgi:hypothetical protein
VRTARCRITTPSHVEGLDEAASSALHPADVCRGARPVNADVIWIFGLLIALMLSGNGRSPDLARSSPCSCFCSRCPTCRCTRLALKLFTGIVKFDDHGKIRVLHSGRQLPSRAAGCRDSA